MEILKPNRMLVILAHPDDESFAVGGTLAKYADQGVQIILLTATRGEAGIQDLEPAKAGAIREQELRRAAEHLGIEVFFLGYMDGELSRVDPSKLMENLCCWIGLVKPQVILTFGPDGISGHPDHVTISLVVTQVVEKFYPKVALLYIAPSEATCMGCGVSSSSEDSDRPLVSVDVSEYRIQKIRAIQSHASQEPPLTGKAEEEVDKIPCYEYFSIAQSVISSTNLDDYFQVEAGELVT
jgi:LmbE family N-acetylglucosaminyl deacetylase